jgi:hypothetical protein
MTDIPLIISTFLLVAAVLLAMVYAAMEYPDDDTF